MDQQDGNWWLVEYETSGLRPGPGETLGDKYLDTELKGLLAEDYTV